MCAGPEDLYNVMNRDVARNVQANVFRAPVVAEYHHMNRLTLDEPDRFVLLRLFYTAVLRLPSGLAAEKPLDEVVLEVRRRHPTEVDGVLREWAALGELLRSHQQQNQWTVPGR
jgi:hypothetical protein